MAGHELHATRCGKSNDHLEIQMSRVEFLMTDTASFKIWSMSCFIKGRLEISPIRTASIFYLFLHDRWNYKRWGPYLQSCLWGFNMGKLKSSQIPHPMVHCGYTYTHQVKLFLHLYRLRMFIHSDSRFFCQSVVSHVSNIWIGLWANFPPYMDPTLQENGIITIQMWWNFDQKGNGTTWTPLTSDFDSEFFMIY